MLIPSFRPRDKAILTFVAATTDISAQTTYTFTNHAIGTASPDRIVVITAGGNTNVFNSATIGGSPAAVAVSSGGASTFNFIAGLLVPTGTTSTITVVLNGNADRCRLAVYTLTGTGGHFTSKTYDTASNLVGGTGLNSQVTLDIPDGGAILSSGYFRDTTAGMTGCTWTGVTENHDSTVETANHLFTGGSLSGQSAQIGKTITAACNLDADTGVSHLAVSFSPA